MQRAPLFHQTYQGDRIRCQGAYAEHQIRSLSILENDQMTGIVALGDLSVEKDTGQKAKTA